LLLKANAHLIKIYFIFNFFILFYFNLYSQQAVNLSKYHLYESINLTNNGISFIPSLSLGKPAAIFNASIGNNKLSFEPELRFSMDGKPWTFLFWWRYKMIDSDKFKFKLGTYPAFSFKESTTNINGVNTVSSSVQRYLAAEFAPNYIASKNLSMGVYYLFSHGLNNGAINNTHFLTVNSTISNIKLSKNYSLKLVPQIYYLEMDYNSGYYLTSTFTINNKSPFSFSTLFNKIIKTGIASSENFTWNATLTYSIKHKLAFLPND